MPVSPKATSDHGRPDEPLLAPRGDGVDEAGPLHHRGPGVHGAAEQLEAADDAEDHRARRRRLPEVVRLGRHQVGGGPSLVDVLPAADVDEIEGAAEPLVEAGVHEPEADAPPLAPASEDLEVAPVPVDGEQVGVEPADA